MPRSDPEPVAKTYRSIWKDYERKNRARSALLLASFFAAAWGIGQGVSSWHLPAAFTCALVLLIAGAAVRGPLLCPRCGTPWRILRRSTLQNQAGAASQCDKCGLRYGWED